jgi:hypothetical protein
LRCVGLGDGTHFKPGETDVGRIALTLLLQWLANEHIPESSFDLSHLDRNPRHEARKREILEELDRGDDIA